VSVALGVALLVVLAAALLATWLLIRVADAARDIDAKAERIERNGRGINASTDAVLQLRRTNRLARSILESARPLDRKLARIVTLARRIDGTSAQIDRTAATIDAVAGGIESDARAINAVAAAIEGTAGGIEGSATGIDAEGARILTVARLIDRDTLLINTNLDGTIRLARMIDGDTGRILDQALAAHQNAACIDRRTGGRSGFDGHCEGAAGD